MELASFERQGRAGLDRLVRTASAFEPMCT